MIVCFVSFCHYVINNVMNDYLFMVGMHLLERLGSFDLDKLLFPPYETFIWRGFVTWRWVGVGYCSEEGIAYQNAHIY